MATGMKLRAMVAAMLAALATVPAHAQAVASAVIVRSPDGRNALSLTLGADGRPTYSVSRDGDLVIVMSNGGFDGIHDKLLQALRA